MLKEGELEPGSTDEGFRRRDFLVALLVIGIPLGPVAVMSLYLGFSRWPSEWGTPETDWAVGALAVAVGLLCIVRLPAPVIVRVVLGVIFVPVAGFLLMLYSLWFVGAVFGVWL